VLLQGLPNLDWVSLTRGPEGEVRKEHDVRSGARWPVNGQSARQILDTVLDLAAPRP
jgi:hypothetical protein